MSIRLRAPRFPQFRTFLTSARRPLFAIVAVTLAAPTLTGCGAPSGDGPSAAATGFYAAIAAANGAGACSFLTTDLADELAESGDCATAVLDEKLAPAGEVADVAVYGLAAEVTLARDVVFLNDAAGHWQVTAAGCTARPDQPYRCRIGG